MLRCVATHKRISNYLIHEPLYLNVSSTRQNELMESCLAMSGVSLVTLVPQLSPSSMSPSSSVRVCPHTSNLAISDSVIYYCAIYSISGSVCCIAGQLPISGRAICYGAV